MMKMPPWYARIEKIIAPTEQASNLILIALILITVWVILRGSPVVKAGWAVYLISP